jgi:hypothetical protein
MKIEITPDQSRLVCELLETHRAKVSNSLEKFMSLDCNRFSLQLSEQLQKHIAFIMNDLQSIDSLISELREVR